MEPRDMKDDFFLECPDEHGQNFAHQHKIQHAENRPQNQSLGLRFVAQKDKQYPDENGRHHGCGSVALLRMGYFRTHLFIVFHNIDDLPVYDIAAPGNTEQDEHHR